MKMNVLKPILVLYISLICRIVFTQQDTAQMITTTKPMIEVEYDLIVFEPGYETYLNMQLPMEHYSVSFYKNWNTFYVKEWNIRSINNNLVGVYQEQIDYDVLINYGIELEYKLYYFFRFIEQKYGIVLIKRPAKAN